VQCTKLFTVKVAIVNLSLPKFNLHPKLSEFYPYPQFETSGEASIPRVIQLPPLALLKGLNGFHKKVYREPKKDGVPASLGTTTRVYAYPQQPCSRVSRVFKRRLTPNLRRWVGRIKSDTTPRVCDDPKQPFQRDSRVFTRRLTPKLIARKTHKNTNRIWTKWIYDCKYIYSIYKNEIQGDLKTRGYPVTPTGLTQGTRRFYELRDPRTLQSNLLSYRHKILEFLRETIIQLST